MRAHVILDNNHHIFIMQSDFLTVILALGQRKNPTKTKMEKAEARHFKINISSLMYFLFELFRFVLKHLSSRESRGLKVVFSTNIQQL